MKGYLHNLRDRLRAWTLRHVEGKHAERWLAKFSFAEASFFPIPPDILLIAMVVADKKRWVRFSTITTVFSVLGGIFGYVLGILFFDLAGETIVAFYGLEEQMAQVSLSFEENAFMAIFLASFTPIPFKVFTIAGGIAKINFLVFVVAALFGRGMRFFALGYLLKRFGKKLGEVTYQYFNLLTAIVIVALLAVILSTFI